MECTAEGGLFDESEKETMISKVTAKILFKSKRSFQSKKLRGALDRGELTQVLA